MLLIHAHPAISSNTFYTFPSVLGARLALDFFRSDSPSLAIPGGNEEITKRKTEKKIDCK
jgi:hypothetical protein